MAEPPAPVQVRVIVAGLLRENVSEPLVALEPDQPPEAVQLLASVDDHVSVMFSPFLRLVGLVFSVTVGAVVAGGAGLTVTVVLLFALPPVPVQLML